MFLFSKNYLSTIFYSDIIETVIYSDYICCKCSYSTTKKSAVGLDGSSSLQSIETTTRMDFEQSHTRPLPAVERTEICVHWPETRYKPTWDTLIVTSLAFFPLKTTPKHHNPFNFCSDKHFSRPFECGRCVAMQAFHWLTSFRW